MEEANYNYIVVFRLCSEALYGVQWTLDIRHIGSGEQNTNSFTLATILWEFIAINNKIFCASLQAEQRSVNWTTEHSTHTGRPVCDIWYNEAITFTIRSFFRGLKLNRLRVKNGGGGFIFMKKGNHSKAVKHSRGFQVRIRAQLIGLIVKRLDISVFRVKRGEGNANSKCLNVP